MYPRLFLLMDTQLTRVESAYRLIPDETLEGLLEYRERGQVSNGFLRHVLQNELAGAVDTATPMDLRALPQIVSFMERELGDTAWGSAEAIRRYRQKRKAVLGKATWEEDSPGREILSGGDFLVEYVFCASLQSSEGPVKQTRLIDRRDEKERQYAIEGDYRKQFEERLPQGFSACYELWDRLKRRKAKNS